MKPAGRSVILEISDITATRAYSIQVVLKNTGKRTWLPRSVIEVIPGRVIIPEWLADRIFNEKSKQGRTRAPA